MRVFLTGGSGYLGAPLTAALVGAGHRVVALARSDAAARLLERLGAHPFAGDLRQPAPIADEAARCDAFVHLAQDLGPERYETDARLIDALVHPAGGEGVLRHLVYTSTLFVLGEVAGEPADERTQPRPPAFLAPRAEIERRVLAAGGSGIVATVIRPGMVYGGGDGGSVGELFRSAVERGAAGFVGNGGNRWSLVHRSDLAGLYLAVLAQRAPGLVHAVDARPLPVVEVARAASRAAGRGGAVAAVPLDEARRELGTFADALALDQPAVTLRAEELRWQPRWPPFDESAPEAFDEWRHCTGAPGTDPATSSPP
jgi:nucleoside-diphosphate-sugar epimerase